MKQGRKGKNSFRHKIHIFTYDNPRINRTVVTMRRSFDEVCKVLNAKDKPGASR